MKKLNVKAFICLIAMILLVNICRAQNIPSIGDITGKITWKEMLCHVVPYKIVADGKIGVKDYNFVIEVRSYEGANGQPGDLIPGQKVAFGTTTAESQAFTITGIPFYIIDAWLVFRFKKDICPGCVIDNYKISKIQLYRANAKGLIAPLSCERPIKATSGQ